MESILLGIDARAAEPGARQFEAAGERVTRSAKSVDNQLRGLDGRFVKTDATARKLGGTLRGLFAGVSLAVAIRSAVSSISNFEEVIATLGGVANASSQELVNLEDTAKELGATTRFSASEAGEGLLFLARAGFDVQEAIAAVPETLNLAAAGTLQLGEAADIASNVLSQFGLEAENTAEVTDALVRTANTANTDVRQLAEALKLAGPVAGALGIELLDASQAIGILGDAGIQGSLAGTNLRGVLLALAAPTSAAQQAFKALGIEADDVNPAINSLSDVLNTLAESGVGAANNVDLANDIFGRRNIAAAQVLTSAVEKFDEQTNRTGKSARELAAIMDDTLSGSFRSLRSATEALFLSFGDSGLGSALRSVADGATDVIRVLAGFDDELNGSRQQAELLAKAVVFLSGAAGFVLLTKSIFATVGAVKALTVAFATSGIGTIPVLIGAAVGATIAFREEIANLEVGGKRVGDILVATFNAVKERVDFLFPRVARLAAEAWQAISQGARIAFDAVLGTANDVLGALGTNVDETAAFFGEVWRTQINFVIGLFRSLTDIVVDVSSLVIENFKAFGQVDFSNPLEFVKSLSSVTFENLERGLETAKGLGSDLSKNFTTDYVGQLGEAGRQGAEALVDGFRGAKGADAVNEFFGSFFEDIDQGVAELEGERQAESFAMGLIEKAKELAPQILGYFGFGNDVKIEAPEFDISQFLPDTDQLNASAEGFSNLSSESEDFLNAISDETELLELERELLGASNAEREFRLALLEADRLGINANTAELEKFKESLLALEEAEKLTKIGEDIGRSFGDALEGVIFDSENAGDALEALFEQLARQAFQQGVTDNLSAGLGSFFSSFGSAPSALGNIFSTANDGSTSLTPFAQGGVFETGDQGTSVQPFADGGVFESDGESTTVAPFEKGGVFESGDQGTSVKPFADGGVFETSGGPSASSSSPATAPFADGGVFTTPFTFPLDDGRQGLGAEAGDEALMPLERNSEGKLSVNTSNGEDSGGGRGPITFVQNINGVSDLGSFRKTRRQQEQNAVQIARNFN